MQTPSPITPDFAFETLSQGLPSPNYAQQHYFDMQQNGMQRKDYSNHYAPVAHTTGPLPYPAQPAFYAPQQIMEQHAAPAAPASANARPKKNSYPCPMAKQFQCSDYFTTSGHAARHAKKHTGKKDAYCPECNKAFTRKDNMEQHRRTHQSGRSAKGSENGVKKAKPASKRPKPSPLQSSAPAMSLPLLDSLDPALPISPDTSNFMAPAVQPAVSYLEYDQGRSAYPDPVQYAMNSHSYSIGSSSGLDALAIAASGEKRKFE
jgi:hypothetical protein